MRIVVGIYTKVSQALVKQKKQYYHYNKTTTGF